MKIPEKLTKVTKLSKIIALILFIILPFLGFYLGTLYQKQITPKDSPEVKVSTNNETFITTTPTVIPTITPTEESNEMKIFDKFIVASQEQDPDWLEYTNDYCKIKMSYPPTKPPYTDTELSDGFRDWKVYESTRQNTFNHTKQILVYAPIAIDIPAEGEINDIYSVKIGCTINSSNITVDQYFEKIQQDLKTQRINKKIDEIKKLSKINIYGKDGYIIEMKRPDTERFFNTAVIFTNGKYSYLMEIGIETTDIDLNTNINKVLNSVRLM